MMKWCWVLLVVGIGSVCTGAYAQGGAAAGFVLREQLGNMWSNECVSFPMDAAQAQLARQGRALIGPGDQEVAYQVTEAVPTPRISFQTSLPPYQTQTFSFTGAAAAAAPRTDMQVTETAESVKVENSRIGIEIRKQLQPGQGPIAALRLRSGAWTGASTLEGGPAITDYRINVMARGPVFAEIFCRLTFANQGSWMLRFRVERGEPVIKVDEYFDVPNGGVFRVLLGGNTFRPTQMLYRNNADANAPIVTAGPIAGYYLEPWIHWQNAGRGNWLAFFTPTPPGAAVSPQDPLSDMLMIGVLRPSVWVDPAWKGKAGQAGSGVSADVKDGIERIAFPLGGGRRIWMLGTPDKTTSLAVLAEANKNVAPLPQKYLIKYGDFPLNEVKDYILDWPGDHDNYPRLFIHKQDLPAIRQQMKSTDKLKFYLDNPALIDKYSIGISIQEYLASDDERLGRLLLAKGEEWLQDVSIESFINQNRRHALGVAPHMQALMFMPTMNTLDAVLGSNLVTEEQRRRILARIAFIGYTVNRDDYWSPPRGYSGFPNMTTVVALYQTAIGCMIPSHPLAKEWAEHGLHELYDNELMQWSDEDGGWLEAPHYAMVSFDCILGGLLMASNAGFDDNSHSARVRKVMDWFANISTPRDVRTLGFRHLPAIGNTYWGERTAMFGIIAGLWSRRDPEFAGNMQWMYEEQGKPGGLGGGWSFPTMVGNTQALLSRNVTPRKPNYGSAWFRQTGVVLRSGLGTEYETYLHLIAGSHQSHYDYDSGAITLWGKGALISDDWGYIGKHGGEYHSVQGGGGGTMNIEDFAVTPAFDCVSGRNDTWQRQIGFAKDPDPRGPNFFLLRDANNADAATSWRLWLTARDVKVTPTGALVDVEDFLVDNQRVADTGNRVAMDVFCYQPERLKLSTRVYEQKVGTAYRDCKEGPITIKQICLTAGQPGRNTMSTLLYPRLAAERAPTVTWHADGRIAQVDSQWGTDYICMATKRRRTADPDGNTLLPLFGADRKTGSLVRKPVDGDMPQMMVNQVDTGVKNSTYNLPARAIALHPAEKNPVTAVWQSPITGTVKVEVRLVDGDAGGSDGVTYELRQGTKVLAGGVMPNGGAATCGVDATAVVKGELIRLVIRPRESNWWDTTLTEMIVTDTRGNQWNLREAVLAGDKVGNDARIPPAQAIWWICEGDAAQFDPRVLTPTVDEYATADRKVTFQGTSGAIRIRGNQVTLSLGSAGKISYGENTLISDGPTSRTETIR